jgi:esterase/lipase
MQRRLFIKNRKGLKLAAIIQKPRGKGPFPTVILLHGFTGYKEEANIVKLAKGLEKERIASIRFDASGFNESEGTIKDNYRFSNYVKDVESVYSYLKKLNFVDSSRIGVCGHSLGAQLSIIWGSTHPEVKCICPISPPIKLVTQDVYKNLIKEWKQKGYFEKTSSNSRIGKIRIPGEFIEDAWKWNTLDYIEKVKQPIFIITGSEDKDVYPFISKEIYDKANQPKKYIEIEGIGHHYKKTPEHIPLVNREVIKFFKKYLS